MNDVPQPGSPPHSQAQLSRRKFIGAWMIGGLAAAGVAGSLLGACTSPPAPSAPTAAPAAPAAAAPTAAPTAAAAAPTTAPAAAAPTSAPAAPPATHPTPCLTPLPEKPFKLPDVLHLHPPRAL